MTLYIEYVILDNLVMDYIILKFLEVSFKEKIRKRNKCLVCVFGVISAIFLPFIRGYQILLFLYKIITLCIMVLFIKKYKKIKNYFLYLAGFISYTFLIGGVCLGLINLLGIQYAMSGILLYNFEFPVSLFILMFSVLLWFVRYIIIAFKKRLKASNYLYNITLFDGGRTIDAVGFFDSGNKVTFDGNGVNIISLNLFLRLYKDFPLERLYLKQNIDYDLKNLNYIDIGGLSAKEKYLSFTIDKVIVEKNIFENVTIAVALKNFDNFDCILHSNLVGGDI